MSLRLTVVALLLSTTLAGCGDVVRRETTDAGADDTPSGAEDASAGAGSGGGPAADGVGSAGVGGDADGCSGGIRWLAPSFERSRTRYVEPALAGDSDAFLIVTTARVPDRCEDLPCVIVEHFGSRGVGSSVSYVAYRPTSERIRLFAGTDHGGTGHFAMAMDTSVPDITGATQGEELAWGVGAAGAMSPSRLALDPARGLGTVAFEREGIVTVTHGWEAEGTVGEGFSYPIDPVVARVDAAGTISEVAGIDPTGGELFIDPMLVPSAAGLWFLTRRFPSGGLDAAGPPGTQPIDLANAWGGGHAVVALASGALVVAEGSVGEAALLRIGVDGATTSGPSLRSGADGSRIALGAFGEKVVVAHHGDDGAVHVTVLDAALAVEATATVPGTIGIGDYPTLRVAASADGTFAVLVAPFPVGPDEKTAEPIYVHRFETCK